MAPSLIVGNWKMNPSSLEEAQRIARKVRRVARRLEYVTAVVCPPFAFLAGLLPRRPAAHFDLGAQSVSAHENGAHTGEVAAPMLASMKIGYVIVGHSEERERGESDEAVSAKVGAVIASGMTAIVCVGERSRDENGSYLEGLKTQIKKSLSGISAAQAKKVVIAYEPVWAIGAAEPMRPEDIYETSIFIKKAFADLFGSTAGLKVRVLYGGAVNFRNAPDIMTIGTVDGLLVGRESVNVLGFIELLKAVDTLSR